jgi:NHLM bacteriocin system ABC transporter ATP-binding protein
MSELVETAGAVLRPGPARPLALDNRTRVWIVRSGRLDLFAVQIDAAGEPVRHGRYLFGLVAGDACFGIAAAACADGTRIALRGAAPSGTEVIAFERDRWVADPSEAGRIAERVELWVATLSTALAGSDMRADALIEADSERQIKRGTRVGPIRGGVVWIEPQEGTLRWFGSEAAGIAPGAPPWPLAGPGWAEAISAVRLTTRSTASLQAEGPDGATLWQALDHANARCVGLLAREIAVRDAAEEARISRKLRVNAGMFASSLGRVAGVLRKSALPTEPEAAGDPLFAAAVLVTARLGIRLKPQTGMPDPDGQARLDALCRAARVNLRRVGLADGWYRKDNGPLLGFRAGAQGSALPVALLPIGATGYELVDPEGGASQRIGPPEAAMLLPTAYTFYRSLPDLPASVAGVVRFGAAGMRTDIVRMFGMGLIGGLLALVTPMVSEPLFGDILPRADVATLAVVVLAMAMATIGTTAFAIVRGFSLLRLEGRMEAVLQAGLWDRLLRLPTSFFRQFTTGDLANRAMSIAAIRTLLTSTVNSAIMDGLFSIVSFALLFYYSWRLALVAAGLAAVAIITSVGLSVWQVPHQRAAMRGTGEIGGMTFQMLMAVGKLRVAGAEARAFGRWATALAEQNGHFFRARRVAALQQVVAQSFPPLAALVIYAAVMKLGPAEANGPAVLPLLTLGAFMAFNTAFGQFLAALMALVSALTTTAVMMVPLYERISPILRTVPEAHENAAPPGELTGDIEFRHVTFRYLEGAPPILDDVSWQIAPGGYIAFVGPSGSGKSTLIRLLLGFEQPESGGIFFDRKDLSSLDLGELRRQIGVVMQGAAVISGNIYDNIVGSLPASMEDAWQAARMAGLADDIRAMPMGMHTVLSEAASTLSGGQRQRVIIARALVRRPRILIFDEATSALDNRTQAIVNESIDQLNMTRIVVAHRLSTIRHVDRVYVLSNGRIVESGPPDKLINADGLFSQMARRQSA